LDVSNPQTRRTSNRRKKLNRLWNSKEHKERVKAFIADRPCQWCGSMEYRTAHHPYRSSYGEDIYTDLELSQCMVLCRRCHMALHKGLKLCPICKKHYAPFERDMCFHCYCEKYPEVMEKVNSSKEKRKEDQKKARHEAYLKSKKWKEEHKEHKEHRNGKDAAKRPDKRSKG